MTKKKTDDQRRCVMLIKQARRTIVLTDLAHKLGVSPASVWRWEQGGAVPCRLTATRLVLVLEELGG